MDEGLIARRYAKALFRYAQSLGVEELVYDKMKLFQANYISHPDLQKALLNPMLSVDDKIQLLSTAIGIEPGQAYLRAIRLLIKNHREMYMRSICLMYQKLYREAYGIIRVKVVTATDLKEEGLERIKAFVRKHTDKTIEFVHKIDPAIIGGFILVIGTRQLDASLLRELKDIRLGLLK
ncbi:MULTISPECIES: F0F1 ATP synthase subunit delta [Porphyromonadaceae]|uniref:ATP synthase subunit delta n=1 Tax=Sanguibacteroides justesenii TaxID=1547597 RepID=A0A0C3R405_9PORP|nr:MULTISPECIES: F0F1 ATP synthase subunit delta [Porphyromonadaceae]KIO44045.1 ATP synthase subunit delta [Sanguibacteroides justesenii]KIO47295.1 ATP synthase subunit delta [Sanguibacteroides justesenii]MCR9012698.1 F0F1 ATP synthase subunit delta [Gabonibacter chumensis]PXZ43920.1 ATP synthase F1 subunit delta [Sanguibacteroides justesenii]